MKLTFKRATDDDWKTVLSVESKAGTPYYLPFTKQDEVKRYIQKSRVFLIQMNNKTIGTISYEMKSEKHAYMDGLTILPENRRKGIATEALKYVMNQLSGAEKIELVVHPRNVPAIKLYLTFGFYFTDWKDNYFGDGTPRLLMERP